jgi:CRISPR/Cas system-associated exonuclease Cas4 (RecB family)
MKDGVIVFDYKTGRAKDKLDTEDKEQLYLYQLALEERGIKVEKMQYVYVLDWVTREVELLSGEKREEFVESMMTRMEHILTSEYGATPEPFTCKYCDFQAICEFKKL